MAEPTPPPVKEPYTSTETKTFKIVGPIELTLTTKYDSSHVPPTPAARAAESDGLMDALRPLAEMILAKLDEIRQAQNPQ
jgi:hypothetical protein